MAVTSRLGPYEILGPLGAGGMGEVYRARDTRLDREVAIKILPEAFSRDADRLRRFEQEAIAAGALNHPNILVVHDIGAQNGTPYVVTELLQGETLRAKLAGGALPLRKAVDYAAGITEGLAAAHQKGIVHRDLKPENIFITENGRAKILDFGLAKLTQPAGARGKPDDVSTELAVTEPGTVLGTAGYMSPEQASGRPVDFRSDQFSFGVILYEMVTGKQPFRRSTAPETLAAIIREEPVPVNSLNPQVPTPLRWIVECCLTKDPAERYASTRDLARDVERVRGHLLELSSSKEALAVPLIAPKRRFRPLLFAGLGLVILAAMAAAGRWWGRSTAPGAPELRPLTYSGHDSSPAASPDGRAIVFSSDRDGTRRIWLKDLASGSEVALTTDGPDDYPRFSPDGSMIVFTRGVVGATEAITASASLYRVPIVGGEPRKLVGDAAMGDWSPDGRQIAFVRRKGGAFVIGIVGADGTAPHEIAQSMQLAAPGSFYPRWSPDGRTIAVAQASGGSGMPYSILLVDADGKGTRSISSASGGFRISSVAWSGSGDDIVYSQGESVSSNSLVPSAGTARVIRQNIHSGGSQTLLRIPNNSAAFDIIGSGRVVFDSFSSRQNLREVFLNGKKAPQYRWLTQGESQDRQPVYSPDGEWVLFTSNRSGNLDLWEASTKSGALRRITDDVADDWDPAFAADGKKILWSSNRSGHLEIWMADADGSGARQVTNDGKDAENPTATRDGQWIVYDSRNPNKLGRWKIHPDGSSATRIGEGQCPVPGVSPDGQYLICGGGPGSARAVRIADGAVLPLVFRGNRPHWMADGRAVALLGRDEKGVAGIFMQDFDPNRDTSKTARALGGFDPEMTTETYGISPDGTRMTIASQENLVNLMQAERVPGVTRPARQGK